MDGFNKIPNVDETFRYSSPSLKPTNAERTSNFVSVSNSNIDLPNLPTSVHANTENTINNQQAGSQYQQLPPPPPPPHKGSTSIFLPISSGQGRSNVSPPPTQLPSSTASKMQSQHNPISNTSINGLNSTVSTQIPNSVSVQSTQISSLPPVPPVPQAPPVPNSRNMQRPPTVGNGRPPNLEKLAPGTLLTVGKHQVTIVKYLSEGGYAHIYIVKTDPMEQGTDTACLKRVIVPNKEGLNQLRAEVEVMQRLSNADNIVRYYDSNASRLPHSPGCYEVLVLMELCPNKSLLDFMNSRLRTKLTTKEILKIMLDISKAVYNMHRMKLIHRDIKIENVLLDENYNFKLADFGSTCPILRVPRNQQEFQILHNDILLQTTPQYRSPEMIDLYRGLPIDEKSDIWALGVFLYKLCYYTTPFEVAGELSILHAAYKFPAQPHFASGLRNLINIMLQENPFFRPNIYQVLIEVCKLSGFNNETIAKITDGYADLYNMGSYQYPSTEQMHPAIEPFTSSLVPMFSPFKAAPRDPLEVQMEMNQQLMKQQQQQQQQRTHVTPPPPPPPQPSQRSQTSSSISSNKFSSDSNINTNTDNVSSIEDADPFSTRNLKRSSGTSSSIKSIPKILLTDVKKSNNNEYTSSETKTGMSMGSQKSFINADISVSAEDLNEVDLLKTYEQNTGVDDIGSALNLKRSNNSNTSKLDSDSNYENVEARFPEINISKASVAVKDQNQGEDLNKGQSEQSNLGNVLQVDTGDLKRNKSLKEKRYSVNNPFPMLGDKCMEQDQTGHDSIISFDDIKDELIDLDGSVVQTSSSTPNKYGVHQTHTNELLGSNKMNSKSTLNLNSGYRRLSSEQLTEEIINFSDESS